MASLSILKRIERHIHSVPLKEQVMQARSRLGIQMERLDLMANKIQQKDRELFQRCIGAQMSKDLAHARLYANECAQVRKLAHAVLSSQLALEKVVLRLDTVIEMGEVMADMKPIVGIVAETKTKIEGIVPHVADELGQINSMLSDLSIVAGPVADTSTIVETADEDAKKVLEESAAIAQEKLSQTFPKLPEVFIEQGNLEPQPLLATGDSLPVETRLYHYIRDHQGSLHISQASFDLGQPEPRIREALDRLVSEGRIVLQ